MKYQNLLDSLQFGTLYLSPGGNKGNLLLAQISRGSLPMALNGNFCNHFNLWSGLSPVEISPFYHVRIGYLLAVFKNINLDKETKMEFFFYFKAVFDYLLYCIFYCLLFLLCLSLWGKAPLA